MLVVVAALACSPSGHDANDSDNASRTTIVDDSGMAPSIDASAFAVFDARTSTMAIDIAGSEDAYARMMNDHAAALGLTNTHAVNTGRRIIVAVLGAPSDEARDEAAATLLDWAFALDPPHG